MLKDMSKRFHGIASEEVKNIAVVVEDKGITKSRKIKSRVILT